MEQNGCSGTALSMTDRKQGGAAAGRGQRSSLEPLGTHPCDPLPPTRPHTSLFQHLQTADSKLEYMNRLNHVLDQSPLISLFWTPLQMQQELCSTNFLRVSWCSHVGSQDPPPSHPPPSLCALRETTHHLHTYCLS